MGFEMRVRLSKGVKWAVTAAAESDFFSDLSTPHGVQHRGASQHLLMVHVRQRQQWLTSERSEAGAAPRPPRRAADRTPPCGAAAALRAQIIMS
jgi:hypothetical protein